MKKAAIMIALVLTSSNLWAQNQEQKSSGKTLELPITLSSRPAPAEFPATLADFSDTSTKLVYVKALDAKAGFLKVGDVVLELMGKKVHSQAEITSLLKKHLEGSEAKLKVLRLGQVVEGRVKFSGAARKGHLGLTIGKKGDYTVITALQDRGPAHKAGLRVGDLVVSIDGKVYDSFTQLYAVTRTKAAGTVMSVKVFRGGQAKLVKVPLGEGLAPSYIGISYSTDSSSGVVTVSTVAPWSGADRGGLKAGDQILEIGGKSLKERSISELVETTNPKTTVIFKVRRSKVEDRTSPKGKDH